MLLNKRFDTGTVICLRDSHISPWYMYIKTALWQTENQHKKGTLILPQVMY